MKRAPVATVTVIVLSEVPGTGGTRWDCVTWTRGVGFASSVAVLVARDAADAVGIAHRVYDVPPGPWEPVPRHAEGFVAAVTAGQPGRLGGDVSPRGLRYRYIA